MPMALQPSPRLRPSVADTRRLWFDWGAMRLLVLPWQVRRCRRERAWLLALDPRLHDHDGYEGAAAEGDARRAGGGGHHICRPQGHLVEPVGTVAFEDAMLAGVSLHESCRGSLNISMKWNAENALCGYATSNLKSLACATALCPCARGPVPPSARLLSGGLLLSPWCVRRARFGGRRAFSGPDSSCFVGPAVGRCRASLEWPLASLYRM